MILIDKDEVFGFESAIRGMRNPMDSWDKSDSIFNNIEVNDAHTICGDYIPLPALNISGSDIGPRDHELMLRLAKAGSTHAKYRRMITVYVDITAPLYWWKEFDTYKIGTVANSCSTMHKFHAKEFMLDDFSHEHLIDNEPKSTRTYSPLGMMNATVKNLNILRLLFLETKDEKYWWQLVQLLPSSYNQKRTIMLNYESLSAMYRDRKDHKLDEWRIFCNWIKTLPYNELITLEERRGV